MLTVIADVLLMAGALGAGFYCFVLSRRLRKFNDLEQGVGGAVAVLSTQVDDLTKSLDAAQTAAVHSTDNLAELTERAESVSRRLEMMMASMHDLPGVTEKEPVEEVSETTVDEQEDVQDQVLFATRRRKSVEAA